MGQAWAVGQAEAARVLAISAAAADRAEAAAAAVISGKSFQFFLPNPGPEEQDDVLSPRPMMPYPGTINRIRVLSDPGASPEGGPGLTIAFRRIRAGVSTDIVTVNVDDDEDVSGNVSPGHAALADDFIQADYTTVASNRPGRGLNAVVYYSE